MLSADKILTIRICLQIINVRLQISIPTNHRYSKEWTGHGYINKIEGSVPEWGSEKDCFLSLPLILAEVLS